MNRSRRRAITAGIIFLCVGPALAETSALRLVTTTTTENSGLIHYLIDAFESHHDIEVSVIATGSGRALRHLANGDVDIALTHAPKLESELLASGQAINHQAVMYNDFIVVGPARDPARAGINNGIVGVFRALAASEHLFLSRADESGTHLRESALWAMAGQKPQGGWYRQSGQGMGKTLQIADELDAYVLVDRGTWLAYSRKLRLRLIYQGGDHLFNRYSVLSANPALHPDTNQLGARSLTTWLTSSPAKQLIRNFAIDGHQLFTPLL